MRATPSSEPPVHPSKTALYWTLIGSLLVCLANAPDFWRALLRFHGGGPFVDDFEDSYLIDGLAALLFPAALSALCLAAFEVARRRVSPNRTSRFDVFVRRLLLAVGWLTIAGLETSLMVGAGLGELAIGIGLAWLWLTIAYRLPYKRDRILGVMAFGWACLVAGMSRIIPETFDLCLEFFRSRACPGCEWTLSDREVIHEFLGRLATPAGVLVIASTAGLVTLRLVRRRQALNPGAESPIDEL